MSIKPAYRADVDGLRAVAVLSVVLYHYGAAWLPGGFTGVDVFFVISGFLITGILRREIESGEFSLLAFYDRRIRRIFPALLVMLAVSLAAGWFLLMPGDYADLGGSAAFAALGFGNFFFFSNTGYFDQAADLQPLLHTWSLGVEEQFYLAWPVALWLSLRLVRSRKRFLGLFGIGLALAFAYAVGEVDINPKAAFYLPGPRAWELAVGAFIAFLPALKGRLPGELASLGGAALVGWSLFGVDSKMAFPGVNAVYACLGAALLLWPKQSTVIAKGLAARPMVWVGLISYSLYLWHWPVLVLYRHYTEGNWPGKTEIAALFAAALVISYLSWRFVERPFRKPRLAAWQTVGAGAAAACVVGLAGHLTLEAEGIPARVGPETMAMSGLHVMWKWPCKYRFVEELGGGNHCVFGADWKSAGKRAVLWGDSHAEHLAPLVAASAKGSSLSVALVDSCPASLGGSVRRVWAQVPDFVQRCQDRRESVLRAVRNGHVDVLVLGASWNHLAKYVSSPMDDLEGKALVLFGLRELLQDLARMPTPPRVILVDQFPNFSRDPVACELANTSGLIRKSNCEENTKDAYAWSAVAQPKSFPGFSQLREEFPFVQVITPREVMCAEGGCETRFDGEFLFRDATHLRRNLSDRTLSDFAAHIGLSSALHRSIN